MSDQTPTPDAEPAAEAPEDIVLPLSLTVADPSPRNIARLKLRASEVDGMYDPDTMSPDDYSVAQAVTVLLHNAPSELFGTWVNAWSVETPWDDLAETPVATFDLNEIQTAARALGLTTCIDHLGGGIYGLISGSVIVGPAHYQDGSFIGRDGDFYLSVNDSDDDAIATEELTGDQSADEIAARMAHHLGRSASTPTDAARPAESKDVMATSTTSPKTTPPAPKDRTAYWGTCTECQTTVVVAPHPDRTEDLTDPAEWENGFPRECPVCDESLDWDGSDAVEDVRL